MGVVIVREIAGTAQLYRLWPRFCYACVVTRVTLTPRVEVRVYVYANWQLFRLVGFYSLAMNAHGL